MTDRTADHEQWRTHVDMRAGELKRLRDDPRIDLGEQEAFRITIDEAVSRLKQARDRSMVPK